MASVVVIATLVLINSCKAQLIDCVYNDTNGNILNLNYFRNFTISVPDASYPDDYYNYTVCQNTPRRSFCIDGTTIPTSAMIWYYFGTDDEDCCATAVWDDFQFRPKYTEFNHSWYFYYNINNGYDCADYGWTSEIFWICDNTTEYDAYDTTTTCHLKLYIKSKYACPSIPPPINGTCSWTSGVGDNTLNLTSISKEIIVGQDSSNFSQIFLYTPCNNDIACGSTKALAVLQDFETNTCSKYLALWEGVNGADMNVNYDKANNGSWQFVFTNGEKCNGGYESIFEVFWICDRSVNPFRLISSRTTGICSSQMVISSYLACS